MNTFLENKWLITLTAGILLGLSFPPVDLPFLTFPAFLLLIHLANKCNSYKETAFYSYFGFLAWNLITTYWLMMASVGAGIAAILANSLLMVIPLCLMRFFQRKYTSVVLIVILQATTWVMYEYLHHHWDLAWPWLAIGNAWANQISLIQFITITGHLGISFWVVVVAALAYQTMIKKEQYLFISTLSALLVLPLISLIYFAATTPDQEVDEAVYVSVIQPNHDSYQRHSGMSGTREVLDSLYTITERTVTEQTELVVWPENAIDAALSMNSSHIKRIADSAKVWETNFLIGTGTVSYYEEDLPKVYRVANRPQGDVHYNIFNSSLYIDKIGSTSRYNKANLVPFVERVPFINFFATIDIFDLINWKQFAYYGRGSTPDMLVASSFITPGLVCYDSVYPTWVREFVNNGAGFITIITNDGWWGDSSGHRQHFAYARLRAIEFNRWIVRSANNGTSGIIRSDGSIEQKTDYWVRTGFNSTIPVIKKQTIYSLFGDWLAYQCIGITLVFWMIGILNPKRITTLT